MFYSFARGSEQDRDAVNLSA